MIRIYKYAEGDNGFLMVDGRNVDIPRFRDAEVVHALCLINQVDGLAIVNLSEIADFCLEYLLRDKSLSRDDFHNKVCSCAVAFSDLLGVLPFHTRNYSFEYEGAVRKAYISSHLGECKTVVLDGTVAKSFSPLCLGELDV